mmetsp:Transcript_13111/g.40388  ORF Transcript_13111/g.40388 Transcript_13111/m.40388 type:complete len:113 (-) Transcript_13111:106-444(-)
MLRRTIAAVSRPLLRQRQHSASTLPSSAAIAAIGGHPFSSFEKALQGREATEEMLFVRDLELKQKCQRDAVAQAARLAGATDAFRKKMSSDLSKLMFQKALAERKKLVLAGK